MRFILLIALLLLPSPSIRAEEESLGEKIKLSFQVTPTPTPARKHHKRTTNKSSPTPSPTPKASASPESSPKPTATPKKKAPPSPSPSASPKHRKHKGSPTPSPEPSNSPSPTPTAEESAPPSPTPSESPSATPKLERKSAPPATVSPDELRDYENYSPEVRKLVERALDLTKRNLGYAYGSSDPGNGGMDCSGFIYYVLKQNGVDDVPRDSSEQYVWLRKAGKFQAVLSRDPNSFELDALKPGDLLFWSGTYAIERDPPITHTMIYLGREKRSNKRIMAGASDGRTYEGKQRFGVSVFDFKTAPPPPSNDAKLSPSFVGYGSIPGLGDH